MQWVHLGGGRSKVNGHTFSGFFASHLHNQPHIAVSKATVPSLDIRHASGIQGRRALGNMSHRSRCKGNSVKAAIGGQDASDDGGPTAVSHPAGRAIEVCDIITAAVERQDR